MKYNLQDGNVAKVALHAGAGALTALVGGDNVLSSAAAAGTNEALLPVMKTALGGEAATPQQKALQDSMMKTGSALIGAGVGAATGGNAFGIGNITQSATENNYLTHADTMELAAEIVACKANKECLDKVIRKYEKRSGEQVDGFVYKGCKGSDKEVKTCVYNHLRGAYLAEQDLIHTDSEFWKYIQEHMDKDMGKYAYENFLPLVGNTLRNSENSIILKNQMDMFRDSRQDGNSDFSGFVNNCLQENKLTWLSCTKGSSTWLDALNIGVDAVALHFGIRAGGGRRAGEIGNGAMLADEAMALHPWVTEAGTIKAINAKPRPGASDIETAVGPKITEEPKVSKENTVNSHNHVIQENQQIIIDKNLLDKNWNKSLDGNTTPKAGTIAEIVEKTGARPKPGTKAMPFTMDEAAERVVPEIVNDITNGVINKGRRSVVARAYGLDIVVGKPETAVYARSSQGLTSDKPDILAAYGDAYKPSSTTGKDIKLANCSEANGCASLIDNGHIDGFQPEKVITYSFKVAEYTRHDDGSITIRLAARERCEVYCSNIPYYSSPSDYYRSYISPPITIHPKK